MVAPPVMSRPAASGDACLKRPAARGHAKDSPAKALKTEEQVNATMEEEEQQVDATRKEEEQVFAQRFLQHALEQCSPGMTKAIDRSTSRPVRMSSACSGSGVAELAHMLLMRRLGKPAIVDFSCEVEKPKQEYLSKIIHPHVSSAPSKSTSPCCFDDISHLGRGAARCCIHQGACEVPFWSDFFVAGFSCKDFSTLSQKVPPGQKTTILQSKSGTSGPTFQGVVGHCQLNRPRAVMLENVTQVAKDEIADKLFDTFAECGYYGSVAIFESPDFGLPQRRARAFFLLLLAEEFKLEPDECRTLCTTILKGANMFKMKTEDLKTFLLPDNHERVVNKLQQRQLLERSHMPSGAGPGIEWPGLHTNYLLKKGLTRGLAMASTHIRSSVCYPTLTGRERECLGFAVRYGKEKKWKLASVDIHPSIPFISFGRDRVLQTLVPKHITWLFNPEGLKGSPANRHKKDRLLLGWEALHLQGYDMTILDLCSDYIPSDALLMDLGGNALALPILIALYLSLYSNVDFSAVKPSASSSSRQSVDPSLLSLLADARDD